MACLLLEFATMWPGLQAVCDFKESFGETQIYTVFYFSQVTSAKKCLRFGAVGHKF